ncbi:MAG TPA: ATP synthase F1 subunit gamma [Candidatus Paceibacterota bacterium]|nr:ATP synthase F1 subunit gamma [Candidatus Paceibacterota bacterium]
MAALKAIKSKIKSVEKTQKVTKAMEAVSAAKMRKAQQRALSGRAYARAAASILARTSGSKDLASHPLMRGAENVSSLPAGHRGDGREDTFSAPKTALYIVITSDKGLAGALNSAVLRGSAADIANMGLNPSQVEVVAVGRKANDFFTMRGFTISAFYPNTDQITPELIDTLVSGAAKRFTLGEVEVVKIVYQNFVSTFEQRPTIHTVFPLSLEELQEVVNDILPVRGVYAAQSDTNSKQSVYTIEPSEGEVLSAILPRLASIFVYHALLETQASEHSARMVAMKSASDKAGEMRGSLTLKFNKARQAAITREVSEITGGMEAMLA